MTRNEMNRLIAEKCEGLRVTGPYIDGDYHHPISDYFTNIAACVRAAEAWAAKDPEVRKWWLRRDWNISAVVDQGTMSDVAIMDTPASALATALVRAVK